MPSSPSDRTPPIALSQPLDEKDRRIAVLEQALRVAELERDRAEYRIADLLRRLYGPKSDKIDPAQLLLLQTQLQADDAIREDTPPNVTQPQSTAPEQPAKRKGGGRRPAPEHLPIERVAVEPSAEECQGRTRIREDITEEIDYRPSQYIRRHYVRGVWARADGEGAPLMAPLPPRVIPQSGAGAGLIAHTLVGKYVDHCPLARQEKIAARSGVDLPRQKLGRWVEAGAHLLLTIQEQLARRIRNSGYVQADETPVKVLDPDRGGKAAQAYLWTYHSPDERAIVFDFNLSRGRDSPDRFFPADWHGALQSDGYELYASLAKERPGIQRFGCMAHCRRKVADAVKAGEPAAVSMLLEIGRLYAIEKQAVAEALHAQQRAQLRQERAQPILDGLQRMFAEAYQSALPRSLLGEAARYALNQWPELTRYAAAGNGHVLIDNNPVERGIRPTKLGMKNWMFIGHPDAGWRSAVIYSVVGTCKLLGINPEAYLTWVLPKLAGATTSTVQGLLPHHFAALPTP